MPSGLAALLDDIATIAKVAAFRLTFLQYRPAAIGQIVDATKDPVKWII